MFGSAFVQVAGGGRQAGGEGEYSMAKTYYKLGKPKLYIVLTYKMTAQTQWQELFCCMAWQGSMM